MILALSVIAFMAGVQGKDGPTRARSIGPLQSLFSENDYPLAARRRGVEGTVGFSLEIDSNGRVSDCRIVATSGSSDLDTTTCTLLRERARFEPARDSGGRPLPDTIEARFTWRLADADPYRPFRRDDVQVTLRWAEPDPVCDEVANGQSVGRMTARECLETFGPAVSAVRDARGEFEIIYFGSAAPAGQLPSLDAQAQAGELVWAQIAELEIAPGGEVLACRMIRSVTDDTGSFPFLPRVQMCDFNASAEYRFEPSQSVAVRRFQISNSYRLRRRTGGGELP